VHKIPLRLPPEMPGNAIHQRKRQGTLRYDPISTNGPDSIAAFPRENTRIGAADMPCHWPTSWIYSPRHFPKWAKPEIFRYVRIGKPTGHPFLSRKCQGQNGKRQFSSGCVRLIGSYRSVPCVTPRFALSFRWGIFQSMPIDR
jgi:hypothetical protein